MRLVKIPEEKYDEYRLNLMFDCYKWDPQFLDNNTVAKHALVITKEEHEEIKRITETLDKETIEAENFLNKNLHMAKPLALPKKIYSELKRMKNYDSKKHVRLMRYDFHPVIDGSFSVSEVNSDVPGGFAESTLMPQEAIKAITAGDENVEFSFINFGDILAESIKEKIKENGTIFFVHCTCYSDDRQVMQYLGDKLKKDGYKVIYGAADHLRFKDKKAYSILSGNECEVDAIFRFTPLEWLKDMKPKFWDGYFDTITTSCNHPVAIFAQTKRFPLIWDKLKRRGISLENWKKYLPETIEVKKAKGKDGFIYKPACGRVGEKISIKEACSKDEYKEILKDVKRHPKEYLAQKKFISRPIVDEDGKEYHVCLGSYTVNGKHSGYYARVSNLPRIDSNAADIPVLIERSQK